MSLRLAALAIAVIVAATAGLLVGGTSVAAHDVFAALLHPHAQNDIGTIVWQLRLSRVVIAGIIGCALACGGFMLQGMLRNPLADPYLTGVSAGAATGIVIAITAGHGPAFVPAVWFVAGIATAALV